MAELGSSPGPIPQPHAGVELRPSEHRQHPSDSPGPRLVWLQPSAGLACWRFYTRAKKGMAGQSYQSWAPHFPFSPPPDSPFQIPWPASDKKKSECAFKKSNEVSRGGDRGARGENPGVPRPALADLSLREVCVTAARIVVEAQGPPPRCPALLPTRKWGQPPGARDFGASGLET